MPRKVMSTLADHQVNLDVNVINGRSFSISPDQALQILGDKKNQINFPVATLGEIITVLNEEWESLPLVSRDRRKM